MDAHHALDNIDAVRTEVETIVAAAEIEHPCGQLDPETLRRYEEYTHRPYNAASADRRAAS